MRRTNIRMFCMKNHIFWGGFGRKNETLLFILFIGFFWALIFAHKHMTYTGWDTHDFFVVNFMYFSDSLKNGVIPLWNHFILSGSDFVNFGNVGLFSPFLLIFVPLSWIINPLYAYEIMIQCSILLGSIGWFFLMRTYSIDRKISLFGASAYALAVLVPLVGQIEFIYALGSFPWLLFACIKISRVGVIKSIHCIFWGTIWFLFAVYGYLWLNLINLLIAGLFSIGLCTQVASATGASSQSLRSCIVNLMIFLATICFLYACLELPALLSMKFHYGIFNGDFVSPEPRLRGLKPPEVFSFSSIYYSIIATIDPYILQNNATLFKEVLKWSVGVGIIPTLIFFIAPWNKFSWQLLFWISLIISALLYSAANNTVLGKLIRVIPLINANRWWFMGLVYVFMALLISAIPRLALFQDPAFNLKRHKIKVLLVSGLMLSLFIYYHAPVREYVVLMIGTVLIFLLGIVKNKKAWNGVIIILMLINIMAFASILHSNFYQGFLLLANDDKHYAQQISDRNKSTTITKNFRRLGAGHDYIYNDVHWLMRKVPFSHGYNILSNPLYWYIKNEPFLSSIVTVTQLIRKPKDIRRSAYSSDNTFADALIADIKEDPNRPLVEKAHYRNLPIQQDFTWNLDKLEINPNSALMQVRTNAKAYLLFNNVDFPGWNVYVNGIKSPLIRINRIFQGVFLDGPGTYEVMFKFRPVLTIAAIALPYIVLFLCLICYLFFRQYDINNMRIMVRKSKDSAK